MIADLERQAEIERLARVLGVEPAALDALAEAEPEDLRALSANVATHLHERHAGAFDKAIAVAGKLPSGLTAKLAQHAMGATLSARAAALLEPKQAADLAGKLPAPFLAEVAAQVDLQRVGPLLDGIKPEVMAETGAHLVEQEEWIVLGTFVGHVDPDVLGELLGAFDAQALLKAGFFVDRADRFDVIVGSLDDDRLAGLLATAAADDLWHEAFGMFGHLGDAQLARVREAVDAMDDDARGALAARLDEDPALAEAVAEVRAPA